MPRLAPPPKKPGEQTGPRRLNGALLDVRAVAERLGDTERGVRAKIRRGLIPYRRLGSRVVVLSVDLDGFLRQSA
jgi:hypothetical protein